MNNNLNYVKNSFGLVEKRKGGFTGFSEKINGRAAMVGFIVLFLIELITKNKIMDLVP
jgi:hypothetical protein